MHLLDEIFAERDQQHDAQQPAEERREKHLVKCRVEPEDVERREPRHPVKAARSRASKDAEAVSKRSRALAGSCARRDLR